MGAAIIGFILGVGLTSFVGVGVALGVGSTKEPLLPVGIFAVVAVVAMFMSIRMFRAPDRGGMFTAGLLLGVGLVSICEGICFTQLS